MSDKRFVVIYQDKLGERDYGYIYAESATEAKRNFELNSHHTLLDMIETECGGLGYLIRYNEDNL